MKLVITVTEMLILEDVNNHIKILIPLMLYMMMILRLKRKSIIMIERFGNT